MAFPSVSLLRRTALLFLMAVSIAACTSTAPSSPDTLGFKDMSLEELQSYDTSSLTEDQSEHHASALTKATKAAQKASRKSSGYCSRAAEARGSC